MKRRIFSFILAVLTVCSLVPFGVFAEETGADVDLDNLLRTKFTVSSVLAGNDDETVEISISVDKNGGFAGMNYQLLFDGDALEIEGEPVLGDLDGFDAIYGSPASKGSHIAMLTSVNGGNVYGDGVLATYTFTLKPGVKAGTYDITLITDGKAALPGGSDVALEVLDENFEAVPHIVSSGSITIPGYTVTYDANGGSGVPSSQTKNKNDFVYISSTCPSMEGYTFLGWSTDKNAASVEYKAGDKYSANADLTLYAVWKKLEVIGGSIDFIVSTEEAKTGEEVEVTVSVDNHLGFNGLSFDVIYDNTKLDYVSYTQKMFFNGMLEASAPDKYENKVNFQVLAGTQNVVEAGELVTLKFKVLDEAEDGFSAISVVPTDAFCLYGPNMEPATLTTNIENGGVEISSQIPGDINLDEAINSDDAVLLLKHIAEGTEIEYKGSVDFNGDGEENEDDAVSLLRFVLFPHMFDIEEASLAADSDVVYTVENKLGYTGEEVEVSISLEAVSAFKAAGIANISYNKNVFTLNSFEIADEFGNLMYVKDASEMTFVAAAEEEISSYNGKVLTLNFTINEDAAPGNYTITGTPAAANDVNMNTTIYAGVVTVKDISEKPIIPVEKVVLEKTSLELAKGTSAKLNATVTPDEATNKTLTWTSSNENVATVDNKGVVTAIANGTAKITATSDNGKQATCTVNVIIPADAIDLSGIKVTSVAPAKNITIKAKAICEDGSKPYKTDVTYEIIDGEELATIDAKGKFVAGEEEGDVTVRVKALYGTEDAYEDIVIKICLNLATKVTLNKTKAGMALGYGDLELSAIMACKTGECTDTLTWSVDKPEIATVDENGVVTAHTSGKVKVTAMAGSGKSASCTVTIGEVPATKVDLSGLKTTSVVPGKYITLKAKAGRDDKLKLVSTAVDFKIIEGEELATIDAKGKLVAGSEEGTVIVRAKVEAGTAYEDIIVRICTGLATKVTLNKTKAAMALGYGDLQLEATMVSKEEICEDTLRWIVDKPEIATVDENGLVTAHTSGKVKVTAMAGSGKSASCTVTIGEPATKVDISSIKVTSVAVGKYITLKGKAVRDDKIKPVSTVVEFEILEGHEFATIDAKGKLVAGNEEGTVIVRAKVEAGDAYEDIVINICNPATKVTLNMTKATVTVGDELQLEATMTAKGECTDSLKWISADEEIATVDENGLVTVHSAGKVKITAMAGSGKSAYCTVTVTE